MSNDDAVWPYSFPNLISIQDAQCWAMLHERIGAQTLLASSNMPQSIVSSGSDRGSGSGSGPRKLSTLRPPSQLGTPSSPSIAAVARWSSTKLRLVTQDLTETGRTSDDPLDEVNGTTPTKRREEECNMSRLLAVEGDICVSDEQTTERTEGSKVQVCSSAWLVSSKAVIDCCLITELIQAINYVQSEFLCDESYLWIETGCIQNTTNSFDLLNTECISLEN